MQPNPASSDAFPIEHKEMEAGGEFIIQKDGERIAELTYGLSPKKVMSIDHTWVRPDLRAQGIARKLVDASVQWARSAGVRVRPVCSYARVVLSRDKSAADILVQSAMPLREGR